MSRRLLHRQIELLDYLTSAAAIFGERPGRALPPDGIDRRLLDLEARLSHGKRLAKIRLVFVRTFGILGETREGLIREFAAAYPPVSIGRLDNARQFYRFLSERVGREPREPPYLLDLAGCELALAEVGVGRRKEETLPGETRHNWRNGHIRRAPDIVLLRCAYRIHELLERKSGERAPERCDTPLVIAIPPCGERPAIVELLPVAFDVLAALDNLVDAAIFNTPELESLIDELADHGLIEIRP